MEKLIFMHVAFAAVATYILLIQKTPRLTNAGWLIAIWTVYFIGSIAFFLFRIRQLHILYHERHMPKYCEMNMADIEDKKLPQHYVATYKIGLEEGLMPYFITVEALDLLQDDDFLYDLLDKINQAQTIICIAQYILSGSVEKKILNALDKAFARGVNVFLLVDRSGSSLYLPFSKRVRQIKSLPFNKAFFLEKNLFERLRLVNIRTHGKVAFIDGKYSWIGSHNLRDNIMVNSQPMGNSAHNLTLRVTGKACWQVGRYFERLWFKAKAEKISVNTIACEEAAQPNSEKHAIGNYPFPWVRVTFRESRRHNFTLYHVILSAINHAQKRCLLWTPYFLPPQPIRKALNLARKRGVQVELLIPSKTDSRLVDMAMINFVYQCLLENIIVHTSKPPFDHSKVMIIDDWVLIGSSNIDYRSFLTNQEVNFEVIDASLAQQLSELFRQKISITLTKENYTVSQLKRMASNLLSLPVSLY